MPMTTERARTEPNLWTDVEALARLAVSERATARGLPGRGVGSAPFPAVSFPLFPEREEFAVHAVESPAKLVTGDYYDLFFVSEDRLAIVMADVSGKGVPAAVLKAFTRSMVRNVSTFSLSPADTLTRVNKILHDASLGAMFVTVFLGWYDTRTGALRYANAGHPRPYLIGRDGRISMFGEATGPILGILDVKRYGEGEQPIGEGERLVLYTDGYTEALSPDGDFFGSERLAALLAEHATEPLDRLCELAAKRIDEFQAHQRQDDATILALRRGL
jgi:phosphoserine phosphatase RsbU/P